MCCANECHFSEASRTPTCSDLVELWHRLFSSWCSNSCVGDIKVSFVVVNVTAICPVYLLRRASDLLRWEFKNSSFKLSWKQQTLPIFSESSPFYHTLQQPAPLTAEEEHDLELAHQRLKSICDRSMECNVPVVLDAEDTSIQPAIDYMTYWASLKYNTLSQRFICGTLLVS